MSTIDLAKGQTVFKANCASCHVGGKNLVQPAKDLKKPTLQANSLFSQAAIVTEVTNGKAAMPAFKNRLKTADIANVSGYVLDQANKNWP